MSTKCTYYWRHITSLQKERLLAFGTLRDTYPQSHYIFLQCDSIPAYVLLHDQHPESFTVVGVIQNCLKREVHNLGGQVRRVSIFLNICFECDHKNEKD